VDGLLRASAGTGFVGGGHVHHVVVRLKAADAHRGTAGVEHGHGGDGVVGGAVDFELVADEGAVAEVGGRLPADVEGVMGGVGNGD
jgi:hypothetical protein